MADVEETDDVEPTEFDDLAGTPDELDEGLAATDEPAAPDEASDLEDDEELAVDTVEVEAPEETPVEPAKKGTEGRKGRAGEEEDDDDEDDDEEDDVEADLDTILKDRIAAPPDEGEDEDEVVPAESEERGDGTGRIQPRKPGEFVCQSCFLVKHPSQLADPDNRFCADCV